MFGRVRILWYLRPPLLWVSVTFVAESSFSLDRRRPSAHGAKDERRILVQMRRAKKRRESMFAKTERRNKNDTAFLSFFLGARRLSTPQKHIHSLRGAVDKVGVAGPAGARTCNP